MPLEDVLLSHPRDAQAILRVLVEHYGIPAENIAGRVDISGADVTGWRTGQRSPPPEQLAKLEELHSSWWGLPSPLGRGALWYDPGHDRPRLIPAGSPTPRKLRSQGPVRDRRGWATRAPAAGSGRSGCGVGILTAWCGNALAG